MAEQSAAGRTALVVALVIVLVLVAVVWVGQRSLIYFPDRTSPPPAAAVLPGARDVTLTTSDDVSLGAWYLPPEGTCSAAVLVAQGNGGHRGGRAPLAEVLHQRGFGVLLFDYRGYGGNAGSPTSAGLALDVRAARTFLVEEAEVSPGELVYLGESLGAAVVSELAVEHPPAAMVLRSPFTTLAEVGRAAYGVPLGWLLRDRYAVRENVQAGKVPVAVVYGRQDTIVPASQSREVARAARDAGVEVVEVDLPGVDHNDAVLAHGAALVDAVVSVAEAGGVTGCG